MWMFLFIACSGGVDTSETASTDACNNGFSWPGPNLAGSWTSSFGQNFYDSTCNLSGFGQSTEDWIGALTVNGSLPSNFYMYFGSEIADDTELFVGGADEMGGVTFTGTHAHAEGTVYAQFSGFAHHDQYLDKDVVYGSAFLGMDVDGDAAIDCHARGSWTAFKSGF
jgi:hypothetical protein